MKIYNIWREGYSTTGDYSPAMLLGSAAGESFQAACNSFFEKDPYYNSEKLSLWGCKLYDNGTEARKTFG